MTGGDRTQSSGSSVITSAENPRIKRIAKLLGRAKERREAGCFVAEGKKLFLETPEELRKEVYVTATFEKEEGALLEGVAYEVVDDRLFFKLSDTKSPQGILTIVAMPTYTEQQLLATPAAGREEDQVFLLLEDIRDPGNLGTIFRTAEAAGVAGIFLSEGCADPFQPKVIRSTMGSIYRVPFRSEKDFFRLAERLKEEGVALFATDLDAELSFREAPHVPRSAYLLGNEANGLSESCKALADHTIRIPMQGKVESLNVAIATAILLFDK